MARLPRIILASALALVGLPTLAQFQSDKVTLYRNLTLAQLGATGGNDCWGYVSPSGREYAIAGCVNLTAFVEITDPANPRLLRTIPHTSSTWSDIKVYKNFAYVVTEERTGIQVVDMSDIDNGNVTLVRTLNSPQRSHNIHIDEVSGFLYTCGSNNGTGTTMCFDLRDPSNPVRVGQNSLTTTYQHDVQVHTFTSGPYAGRQIMFGSGEGRGLEIWDVTDKNAVRLIRRVAYPFVGYCHQGWLSPDQRFFYVDDEFDEANNGFTTRSIIFDVSVLETADIIGTFTSGSRAVDHNQYNKNGYIFQANYTSGLRIFDAFSDPRQPVQVGWFDTYPQNDNAQYSGAWSTYPFFPSGTVIVQDINRGLFILDVSEATKRNSATTAFRAVRGRVVSGEVGDLAAEDAKSVVVGRGITANPAEAPVNVEFDASGLWQDVTRLRLNLRHNVNTTGLTQTIEAFDFVANGWVTLQTGAAPTTAQTFTVVATNPDRFVQPGTKTVRARLTLKATGPVSNSNWSTSIDLANVTVNP